MQLQIFPLFKLALRPPFCTYLHILQTLFQLLKTSIGANHHLPELLLAVNTLKLKVKSTIIVYNVQQLPTNQNISLFISE